MIFHYRTGDLKSQNWDRRHITNQKQ